MFRKFRIDDYWVPKESISLQRGLKCLFPVILGNSLVGQPSVKLGLITLSGGNLG